MEKKWFVLYSRPRWEKKIDKALHDKGIESWCPVQKVERQWSDRKKIILDPLFRSYVFVRIKEDEKTKVLMTDGVLNFVYYDKKHAVIRDEEIELIKKYLDEKSARITTTSLEGFNENDLVRVTHGVFMDKEGVVVKGSKRKVYVKFESFGQLMTVEFPTSHLIPL